MKIRLAVSALILATALFLLPIGNAAAYNVYGNACTNVAGGSVCGAQKNAANDPITGTGGVLYKVTTLIAEIGSAAAVIVIIIGGLMYILANGDSNRVNNAKNIVLYAAIGLVVLGLGQAIVVVVLQNF